MKSLTKLKAENLRLYQEDRANNSVIFRAYPIALQIEPTTRCTQRCPICARNYYDELQNPPVDIQPWILEKIEPAIARAEEVVLGGYGEPLIAENIDYTIRFIKERGCKVEVITGVVPLKSERLRQRLIDLGVDRLRLSIDATTERTLKKTRGISLKEMMPTLQALANLANKSNIEFSINFTANLVNISELAEMIRCAKDWSVKKVCVFFQKIYARRQAHLNVFLDPSRVANELAKAREVAVNLKVELSAPDINQREIMCSQPLEFLFIRADGEVLGCCSAVFKGHNWRLPVGHLRDSDIMDLWNKMPLRQFRKAFYTNSEEKYPLPCRTCAFRNLSLESHYRFLDDLAHAGKEQ